MSTVATVIPPTASAPTITQSVGVPAPRPLTINESQLTTAYANFCRVTGTPEELIVDFGLNSQPPGAANEPLVVTERIVMNYFTAKRLLQAIGACVARHESVFGELETNVVKRAVKD